MSSIEDIRKALRSNQRPMEPAVVEPCPKPYWCSAPERNLVMFVLYPKQNEHHNQCCSLSKAELRKATAHLKLNDPALVFHVAENILVAFWLRYPRKLEANRIEDEDRAKQVAEDFIRNGPWAAGAL